MLKPDTRISLADLSAVGVKLGSAEAVAIVRELVLQVSRSRIPGVPSLHVIRIAPSGELFIEGPVAAGSRPVSRAAHLLEALLPPFNAPAGLRAPGALRLILARAMGTLDVPPYPSLESFAEALRRFSPPDAPAAIRELVLRWASAAGVAAQQWVVPDEVLSAGAPSESAGAPIESLVQTSQPPLTVSDIRRARRATGLPLAEVSARSRIPVELLRQLEWGYLKNWPLGLYGRAQLIRYARASGLDEQAVVKTMYPMLGESVNVRTDEPITVEAVDAVVVESVPVAETPAHQDLADIPIEKEPEEARRRRPGKARVGLWLGAAAALLLAVLPLLRDRIEEPLATRLSREVQSTSASPAPIPEDSAPPLTASPPANQTDRTPSRASDVAPARRVTEDAVPAFATAGSAIFYQGQNDQGTALMQTNNSGGDGSILRITRVVDDNARNYHARPSPDGERIAFDSDRDGERGVYVANADGTAVKRVSGAGYAAVPSWSPDGGTLAFVRAEQDQPNVWNLWTVSLENGEIRRLTSRTSGQPWGGSWFADGRRIAYGLEDRLVILDLDSGREKVFVSPRKGRLVRMPAVSPDGRRVIFQVYRDGAWLLDLTDGSMRKILADPTAEEYTWSPDGSRVAYHSRRSGQWGIWLLLAR